MPAKKNTKGKTPGRVEQPSAAPRRIIVRIELTPEAKSRFATVADQYGMTQIAATSRVVEWFAAQPETVQAAVLGQYPADIEADIARLILERLARPAR